MINQSIDCNDYHGNESASVAEGGSQIGWHQEKVVGGLVVEGWLWYGC